MLISTIPRRLLPRRISVFGVTCLSLFARSQAEHCEATGANLLGTLHMFGHTYQDCSFIALKEKIQDCIHLIIQILALYLTLWGES